MKVMKNRAFLLFIFLLAGCSSNVVGIYNAGSMPRKPASFHVYFPDEEESLSAERQKLDLDLAKIIISGLKGKGLSESSIPDLYVSFIISIHTTEETNQTNLSPYDYRYRYNNYGMYDPVRFDSQSYKQGVLIIDIKNADNILVWQGSKSFKLSARKSSTEELLTACQEIITAFETAKVN